MLDRIWCHNGLDQLVVVFVLLFPHAANSDRVCGCERPVEHDVSLRPYGILYRNPSDIRNNGLNHHCEKLISIPRNKTVYLRFDNVPLLEIYQRYLYVVRGSQYEAGLSFPLGMYENVTGREIQISSIQRLCIESRWAHEPYHYEISYSVCKPLATNAIASQIEGTSITSLRCPVGQQFVNPPYEVQSTSCEKGQWTNEPQCAQVKECETPPGIEHGVLIGNLTGKKAGTHSLTFKKGSVATYLCHSGYEHSGNISELVCKANTVSAYWSPNTKLACTSIPSNTAKTNNIDMSSPPKVQAVSSTNSNTTLYVSISAVFGVAIILMFAILLTVHCKAIRRSQISGPPPGVVVPFAQVANELYRPPLPPTMCDFESGTYTTIHSELQSVNDRPDQGADDSNAYLLPDDGYEYIQHPLRRPTTL